MKYILIILATIILESSLRYRHSVVYDLEFKRCKNELILQDNYKSIEQAFICTKRNLELRILGTILFAEGSYLNG